VKGIHKLDYGYLGTFSSAEELTLQQRRTPEVVALFSGRDAVALTLAVAYAPAPLPGRSLPDASPKGACVFG
jgi:hypothetical protein